MPHLILHQFGKTYAGGVIALGPTDLSIADGECFVLLGPSGSGKTTLLRLVAGLETPSSGTLEIDGVRSESLPPYLRGVSFVTQRPALYSHLDVAGNLAISLRFEQKNRRRRDRLPETEITRRVREAAGIVGLSNYLARQPHELSGGEQRRVVLGRAIVAQRKIWLLDEPFSQLDSPLRDRLCGELHLLRRQLGITIVHVTHDPNEAIALADRVGVLSAGELLQTGKPEEVLSRPGNRTVAFCFGWPPINLIDGLTGSNGPGSIIFASRDGWCRVPCKVDCAAGTALTLGIRPEDLKPAPAADRLLLGRGQVIGSQPLAGSWLLDVETAPGTFLRVLGPSTMLREDVELWADPQKLHWFDGKSGWRIEGGIC